MADGVLVVGGDGLIGAALSRTLVAAGTPVFATTRRAGAEAAGRVPFDLASPEGADALPPVAAAVICAGVSGEAACRRDPDRAHRVNVLGPLALARTLAERGSFVVFLSSNVVFDGRAPRVPAAAPLCPTTAYGRAKAEAERRLGEATDALAIVRLTKVFWPAMPRLVAWRRALEAGDEVEALADLRCAPLHLADVVTAIGRIATERRAGIWQLSPREDVSYLEVARQVARCVGADPARVRGRAAADRDEAIATPAHTTLEATRASRELGLALPAASAVIDRLWPDARRGAD